MLSKRPRANLKTSWFFPGAGLARLRLADEWLLNLSKRKGAVIGISIASAPFAWEKETTLAIAKFAQSKCHYRTLNRSFARFCPDPRRARLRDKALLNRLLKEFFVGRWLKAVCDGAPHRNEIGGIGQSCLEYKLLILRAQNAHVDILVALERANVIRVRADAGGP
jgi:hypothetical protein